MNKLSNAFSVLAFADEDAPMASSSSTGKQEESVNGSLEDGDYKQPLVWIDLEMTGLNVEVDRILEIACIITNGDLTQSVEGPDLVVRQTKDCLDKMDDWCQTHHGASGLTKKVLLSAITEREAEQKVKTHVIF
jgi:oligoribonuclease